MPSSHLILGRPLLLLPSIPPSIRVFSKESTLRMRWPKYWSFSFRIIPSKEAPGLISFRMDWLDLLAVQGTEQRLCFAGAAVKRYPHAQGKRNPSKMVGVARGHQRADTLKPYSQETSQSNHTRTTASSNSMKLSHARGATQEGQVMVERPDRTWLTGEGNGKPLQYSFLENPMNSMKRGLKGTQISGEEILYSTGSRASMS